MARSGSMSLPNRRSGALLLGVALVALTGSACAPSPPLSEIENSVFTKSCVFSTCHGASSAPAGGLSLAGSTYERLINVKSAQAPEKRLVVPSDPAGSFLFEKIAQDKPSVGKRMPPGQPLAEEDIAKIRAWIEAGGQNN